MKRIKSYKGFIIKEATQRDINEGKTCKYYCFKNGFEQWETDKLEEMEEWIDSYEEV